MQVVLFTSEIECEAALSHTDIELIDTFVEGTVSWDQMHEHPDGFGWFFTDPGEDILDGTF